MKPVDPMHNIRTARHFFEAMNTIATLDPGYMSSLRYGSTYLASIFHQTDQAHDLIDTALDYSEKKHGSLFIKNQSGNRLSLSTTL